MLGNLGGWHWIAILLIVLLLFGAPKLPALARSLGQSMRIFKTEIKSPDADKNSADKNAAGTGETGRADASASETSGSNDSSTQP